MKPLLIRVKHNETGKSDEAGYKRSPVRIGRNTLNDLSIDEGFISQWHAVVRFDDDGTRFIDLGSTNGTQHAGETLDKNSELAIEGDTELTIGPLTLTFSRQEVDPAQMGGRRRSAFKLSDNTGSGDARTIALGAGGGGLIAPPGMLPPAAMSGGVPPAIDDSATEAIAAPSMMPMQVAKELEPLHGAYRREWDKLLEKISEVLVKAQPAEREGLVHMMRMQYPDALREERCQRLLSELGVDPTLSGAVDPKAWVDRLTDKKTKSTDTSDSVASMERAGAMLEAFAESYVALAKGHDEITKELGIQTAESFGELDHIRDPRKLLAYLMDDKADGEERLSELSRAYAELAVHQIAVLSGVTAGTRATLMNMSPHLLGGGKDALAKTKPSFLDMLMPWSAAKNWYKFVSVFQDQTNSDRFTQTLFGKKFLRMYYRVVGRSGS